MKNGDNSNVTNFPIDEMLREEWERFSKLSDEARIVAATFPLVLESEGESRETMKFALEWIRNKRADPMPLRDRYSAPLLTPLAAVRDLVVNLRDQMALFSDEQRALVPLTLNRLERFAEDVVACLNEIEEFFGVHKGVG